MNADAASRQAPITTLCLKKNASVIYSLFACFSACKIVSGDTRRSTPKTPAVIAITRKMTSLNGSAAYVYPRKADATSIASPKGILLFINAVSVINKRLAWRSAFNTRLGANMSRMPKTAESTPIPKIIIMGFTMSRPLSSSLVGPYFFYTLKDE